MSSITSKSMNMSTVKIIHSRHQGYQNRIGTGKTGRLDQFLPWTGMNRWHEPEKIGSVWNRSFFAKPLGSIQSRPTSAVRRICKFKKKKSKGLGKVLEDPRPPKKTTPTRLLVSHYSFDDFGFVR